MTTIDTATGSFFARTTRDLAGLRARAEGLQSQLSTGQRLGRASDDPAAAARLRALARAESRASADQATASRAAADLSLADSALAGVSGALLRARELVVQAASGTLNDEQRVAIGTELAAIHAQLVDLANSKDAAGHALFGGRANGPAYTLDAAGNAVYAGTGNAGDLPMPEGLAIGRGLTGPQAFGDLFATVRTLAGALQAGGPDPAGAARTSLTALDADLAGVAAAQAVVGARLARIDAASERAARTGEVRATEQAEVGGTDIATTVANLQQTMLTLEASQASFARLSGLSLFALLR